MSMFDLSKEIENIKKTINLDELGMILVHNGIVRGTSKEDNNPVKLMLLSYNKDKLDKLISDIYKKNSGIKRIVVWINEGKLNVGDDMMYVIVAGDRRINILKPFEELIEGIKNQVVQEKETII
jgi:molybdopterin synthase catalytic subunit